MIASIFASSVLAMISFLLFKADFAISTGMGLLFGMAALGALAQAFESDDSETVELQNQKEEVIVEGENLHRNVHFSGRTGSDLVDPRKRSLSEDELEKIIQNAQKALREKGKTVNSVTARRVA